MLNIALLEHEEELFSLAGIPKRSTNEETMDKDATKIDLVNPAGLGHPGFSADADADSKVYNELLQKAESAGMADEWKAAVVHTTLRFTSGIAVKGVTNNIVQRTQKRALLELNTYVCVVK